MARRHRVTRWHQSESAPSSVDPLGQPPSEEPHAEHDACQPEPHRPSRTAKSWLVSSRKLRFRDTSRLSYRTSSNPFHSLDQISIR
jgi:hypothetical protein